ncbi:hypothetical protein L1887_39344 [Cichorium endivia]|nr:hypothetical protein L1887_39344 [Cichorium endivia]
MQFFKTLYKREGKKEIYGFPQQFVKYREQRLKLLPDEDEYRSTSMEMAVSSKESVLDGLLMQTLKGPFLHSNLLSQHGTMLVLAADSKCIEDAIRCGGLAPTKSSCIKNMLSCLLEKRGKLCLEYLRDLSIDEIKTELSQFKGIRPKTIFQISKAIGWVPVHFNATSGVCGCGGTCVFNSNDGGGECFLDSREREITEKAVAVKDGAGVETAVVLGWRPAVDAGNDGRSGGACSGPIVRW